MDVGLNGFEPSSNGPSGIGPNGIGPSGDNPAIFIKAKLSMSTIFIVIHGVY